MPKVKDSAARNVSPFQSATKNGPTSGVHTVFKIIRIEQYSVSSPSSHHIRPLIPLSSSALLSMSPLRRSLHLCSYHCLLVSLPRPIFLLHRLSRPHHDSYSTVFSAPHFFPSRIVGAPRPAAIFSCHISHRVVASYVHYLMGICSRIC